YSLIPGLNMLAPFDLTAPLDPFQLNLFAAKDDCAARLEQRGLLGLATDIELPRHPPDDDVWFEHIEKLAYSGRFLGRWVRFRSGTRGIAHSILYAVPYTRGLLERWRLFPAPGDPDLLAYLDALNDYARAYSQKTPPAYRPAFLARSLATLSDLLGGKSAPYSRLSTWARVAGDAGRRD